MFHFISFPEWPGIITLPPEILTKIFTQESIKTADLARICRVCKYLREVAQTCLRVKPSLTFEIDAKTHPTWKLIRCFIADSIARRRMFERLTEIKVIWRRRDPSDEATWTAQWIWNQQEIDWFKEFEKKRALSNGTVDAILLGIDSEALLPLLLYFTPNLESLDIGKAEYVVVCDRSEEEHRVAFFILNMLRIQKEMRRDKGRHKIELLEAYKKLEDKSEWVDFDWTSKDDKHLRDVMGGPKRCIWWLHSNILEPATWLPGLANLKHVVHRVSEIFWRYPREGLSLDYLKLILSLPRIQTVLFDGCTTRYTAGNFKFAGNPRPGLKSTAKQLELWRYSFQNKEDFEELASLTGSLERAVLRNGLRSEDEDMVARSFLKHNAETLLRENFVWSLTGGVSHADAFGSPWTQRSGNVDGDSWSW
ncbi:hypothetical protein ABW20_dc0101593 [Dactylellina cionopaga]|nr:hypothetical protein ABW20_dc0101593 [Dactylellina cionopaga]